MKKIALFAALLVCVFAFHFLISLAQGGASCPNLLPTRLIVRERARVVNGDPSPLNVREGAGTDHVRLGNIPVSGVFYVLSGFECTEQYTWYRVDYRGLVGWVAEGSDEGYFVEPYPLGG